MMKNADQVPNSGRNDSGASMEEFVPIYKQHRRAVSAMCQSRQADDPDNCASDSFFWAVETFRPWKFVAEEINNPSSLARKIHQQSDAVSAFLSNHIPKIFLKQLRSRKVKKSHSKLQRTLAKALNAIIKGGRVYDAERFAGRLLRSQTIHFQAQNPQGEDLECLDRMLLEDAYPFEIARWETCDLSKKFLKWWFHVARGESSRGYRKDQRAKAFVLAQRIANSGDDADFLARSSNDEIVQMVKEVLSRLKPLHRELLRLFYFEELSIAQINRTPMFEGRTGLKTELWRARKAFLREWLKMRKEEQSDLL